MGVMTDGATIVEPPKPRDAGKLIRRIFLILLIAAITAASVWLFGTERGREHLDRAFIQHLGETVRAWMDDNPVKTISIFIGVYIVCAVLLLPVWWLQMLAGFSFGLWWGLGWVMVASTCGALVTTVVSRWLGDEWVHQRIVGKGKGAKRLKRIVEVADRNGLLVVFISRLSYPIPYGISNYLFGLLEIRARDVAIGTMLGGVPVYAGWVAAGAQPAWLGSWQFWTIVVGVNLAILIPLIVHSMRGATESDDDTKEASDATPSPSGRGPG
jgi:uncharacterized membrane protein YdjX (TVP38/TMEM64 family)